MDLYKYHNYWGRNYNTQNKQSLLDKLLFPLNLNYK